MLLRKLRARRLFGDKKICVFFDFVKTESALKKASKQPTQKREEPKKS